MRNFKTAFLGFIFTIAALSPLSSVGAQDGSKLAPKNALSSIERAVLKYTQAHRLEVGRNTFLETPVLSQVARSFSEQMVKTGVFSHDQADATYEQRIHAFALCMGDCPESSENIWEINFLEMADFVEATNTDEKADALGKEIVEGWLNHEEHRTTIENPLLEEIGVGVALSSDAKLYITQDFLRRTPITPQDSN